MPLQTKLVPSKRRREVTPDSHSLPSTVSSAEPPSNISVSTEYPSSPVAAVEELSHITSNQPQATASPSDDSSPDSDKKLTDMRPLHPSASGTSPHNPLRPSTDPVWSFQSAGVSGSSSPGVTYSEEYHDWTTDPMGMYTYEEYARILASEQLIPRELASFYTENRAHRLTEEEELVPVSTSEIDDIFAAMDDANAVMEAFRPPELPIVAIGSAGPPRPCSPPAPLPQHPPARRERSQPPLIQAINFQPVAAQTATSAPLQAVSHTPREISTPSNAPDETMQSTKQASQYLTSKLASQSLAKRHIPSLEPFTAAPAATPASSRLQSASSSTQAASAEPSSRRDSKKKAKTEIATPPSAVAISPRHLRSSGVKPSPIIRKGKGNPTPVSWEAASTADKMMSQMKDVAVTTAMSWADIAVRWNKHRDADAEEMTWRALGKRYGRMKKRIGVWPGFDDALLEAVQAYSELTTEAFGEIAVELSAEFGWKIGPLVCEVRYDDLKKLGKVDVKGKGRSQRK
ncbi:hypothetical protein N7457_001995 [Penicillium paradoxum]|uniref:uncharacterized protein n=1 Tax=Penicillium paradoxum TaxID=176176 RepID=UPI002547B1D2|nr:uncharacterized protein N7457_001995 [Penicillium paradoxum]KAJ5787005.1 hypothetical protein N7457_001995 [Penicillium paradoxum]